MRIVCPNCRSEYDLPDTAIPLAGREVQCSICNHTWVERPAASSSETLDKIRDLTAAPTEDAPETEAPEAEAPAPEGPTPAAPEPEPEAPQRRPLDPEVAEILRSEAARETSLRAQEKAAEQSEDPTPPVAKAPEPAPKPSKQPPKENTAQSVARNLGKQGETAPKAEPRKAAPKPADDTPPRASAAFARGFAVALLIAIVASLIYVQADDLGSNIPSAVPYLKGYVDGVDAARIWIDAQVNALTQP